MARLIGMGRKPAEPSTGRWEDYLDRGEKLLWQGAPNTSLRFTFVGLILSVFGVFFLGFAIFWISMASQINSGGPMDILFPLFGLPFVLVGLWMVVGHWFFDMYKRRRSRYAVTNKRALIARQLFGRKMESYPIDSQSPITLVEGDLDTVIFAINTYQGKNGTTTTHIGFRYIPDGRKVYNLLMDIREAAE